jgi:hypothetical protein
MALRILKSEPRRRQARLVTKFWELGLWHAVRKSRDPYECMRFVSRLNYALSANGPEESEVKRMAPC